MGGFGFFPGWPAWGCGIELPCGRHFQLPTANCPQIRLLVGPPFFRHSMAPVHEFSFPRIPAGGWRDGWLTRSTLVMSVANNGGQSVVVEHRPGLLAACQSCLARPSLTPRPPETMATKHLKSWWPEPGPRPHPIPLL